MVSGAVSSSKIQWQHLKATQPRKRGERNQVRDIPIFLYQGDIAMAPTRSSMAPVFNVEGVVRLRLLHRIGKFHFMHAI